MAETGEEMIQTLLFMIFFCVCVLCSFSSAGQRCRGQGGRRDSDGRTGLGKKRAGGGKPGISWSLEVGISRWLVP